MKIFLARSLGILLIFAAIGCRPSVFKPMLALANNTGVKIVLNMNGKQYRVDNQAICTVPYDHRIPNNVWTIICNDQMWAYPFVYPPSFMPFMGRQWFKFEVKSDGRVYQFGDSVNDDRLDHVWSEQVEGFPLEPMKRIRISESDITK
jgi:hypothetical protein